jgi:CxxC-x17-CxxC domain-containing protein
LHSPQAKFSRQGKNQINNNYKGNLVTKVLTMAYSNYQNDNGGAPQRQMFDVSALNLKCAECGAPITQLPFQPSGDRPVYCRDCNRNRRQDFRKRF